MTYGFAQQVVVHDFPHNDEVLVPAPVLMDGKNVCRFLFITAMISSILRPFIVTGFSHTTFFPCPTFE